MYRDILMLKFDIDLVLLVGCKEERSHCESTTQFLQVSFQWLV